ncbi:MAG: hypothetical protein VB030_04350 [Eubacterium aggregans]|uniref:DUF7479 domain-containing protein n=1 Tax=Eubacterium aggregans TaxID=81409 RepID=A0A1H4AF48_9FIRM|nr:CLJU_RS11820 family redox protein [Eubacterium aggregans]MDD4692386.1 hypothetical protein [Eubacterium aggregans]MEA5073387.1 hypothetical protein [Eubacterium aggregans]SEA34134.1 hypothetical protein SAMN04515656_10828 [Eubacterium aggregans]
MDKSYYESIDPGTLVCGKCHIPMEKGPVMLEYGGNGFPVELPVCPKCGFIYVPEALAMGKILKVEKQLEDK